MTYPVLYFVNDECRKLAEENDYQYCIQFEGWYLQTDGDWDGEVGLMDEQGLNIFTLEIDKSLAEKRWKLPDKYEGDNKPKKKKEKRRKEIVGGAGWTTAVLLDTNGELIPEAPQARLRIKPSNLTEENFREIVAEIGLLALSVGSLFSYPSSSDRGEQAGDELGHNIDPTGQLLTAPTVLLELYSLMRNLWTEIEKRPLKSFRKEIAPVDITKNFNSPQVLISRKMGLSKKRILAMSSVESLDCSENQFLCYVLDAYLKDTVSGLIKLIEEFDLHPLSNYGSSRLISQITKSSKGTSNNGNLVEVSEFFQKTKKAHDNFEQVSKHSKEKRREVLDRLRECLKWAKDIRCTSFLKNIVTPSSPYLDSQRLIKSPTYGLIIKAYNKCNGSHSSGIERVIRLYRETLSLPVKATWEIYELWCFIKIYSVLATQFRLTPPIDTRSPFDSIALMNEKISIPKGEEFKLQGRLMNGTEINISLWYDTRQAIGDLTPDIKLKVIVNGTENIYYLDAKYKNYQTQGVQEFLQNVFCVAKCKYLGRLNSKASFILHPDLGFDFWGEVPLEVFIKDKFNSDVQNKVSNTCPNPKSSCSSWGNFSPYIGHKYGAIALTPGAKANTQISKLIKLIFQYHGNLLATCLNCGCEAITELNWTMLDWTKEQKQRSKESIIRGTSKSGAALYCSCPQCGDFWVKQRCGNNHKLLKFSDSFHKRSNPDSKSWIYSCPECGGDPDFSSK